MSTPQREQQEEMKSKQPSPTGIRLSDENQERLNYAEKIGLRKGTVVNDVLKLHLRDYLVKIKESKATEMREALSVPVP